MRIVESDSEKLKHLKGIFIRYNSYRGLRQGKKYSPERTLVGSKGTHSGKEDVQNYWEIINEEGDWSIVPEDEFKIIANSVEYILEET